ncbi:aspartate kinase [Allomuricauda sp. XS_ASV26]|jgi:aspartate kinase|uniref:Aspartokinase n=1 Tax=Flagellimonas marinaquae TaxID=254955 RepID=A0AA48HFV8_9FLAO|nr:MULTISPECIES: aspartate kinase [Allomuricauda]MCA0958375.1 aspartate kinase [Allomuricauda ruestringensis]MDP0495383.1 aspartate kinase [Verrucomicrobiota bacterium JB024]USD23760.1 aspartate kinase [Allomuricauda aquimarina]BDW92678.1 aspartokinase [Allomuricauda aquimarina]
MRIFKFGGASVKDADAVKNLVNVLQEVGHKDTLVVVSAMGKMTNAMEKVVESYFNDKRNVKETIQEVIEYHHTIVSDLFKNPEHPVYGKLKVLFDEVTGFLTWNKSPKYAFVYDQVVCYGELLSTTIVSAYLNEIGIANTWLDVRTLIKTDTNYRDAQVNWERTQEQVDSLVDRSKLNITQGFLGSDDNNFTTTLGREGSDYSAAILAYCLNAESVTIWKDVPGVLNADPRNFEETHLLEKISYREAIELAFYGASVIHPKTLQPLQRKEIPLQVKSFVKPKDNGTIVGKGNGIEPKIPCFIVKKNQVLLKLSSLDFSFIVEDNISEIFKLFHDHRLKVDLIQNSAISFSVCLDNKFRGLQPLLEELKRKFKVVCHEDVSLYTIRHFNSDSVKSLQNGKSVLVEQRGKETVQLVVK